jgi:hypothetical protein
MESSSAFSNVGALFAKPATAQAPNLLASNNWATAFCPISKTTQPTYNEEDTIGEQLVAQLQIATNQQQLVANCDQSNLRCQISTFNTENLKSQIVTLKVESLSYGR